MKYYKGPNELDARFYYKWHLVERENSKQIIMPIHIHQSAEIMIVTNGEIKITFGNGEAETLTSGQGVFILPFTPHKYETVNNTEFFRCNFAQSIIPDFFSSLDGKKRENNVFNLSETTLFHTKNKIADEGNLSSWNIQAFLYSVIDDYMKDAKLTEFEFDNHILTRALQYMQNHKNKNISIGDIALGIGYSKSHLSYCINKAANTNFATLLSILRIEDSRIMLKNTDKSILQIALDCGFGSERSFYRQFKSITGISPRDYRKKREFKIKNDPPKKLKNKN